MSEPPFHTGPIWLDAIKIVVLFIGLWTLAAFFLRLHVRHQRAATAAAVSAADAGSARPPGPQLNGSGPRPGLDPPATGPEAVSSVEATHADIIDVNVADRATLMSLPGVDADLAARIFAARETRRRFDSLDDLIVAVGLQPHQVARLRHRVAFGAGPTGDGPGGRAAGGRILDI
jgi:DNA uptake protein ComE-like DNA-binding protein